MGGCKRFVLVGSKFKKYKCSLFENRGEKGGSTPGELKFKKLCKCFVPGEFKFRKLI
jgi:hypothetical protein